ncbi:MAG TPA: hypothetical protein VLA37_03355 [Sphingomonadaceae bacterium]|nr:hypothetical protein [Sphingomonadaceae bacterium]
MLDLLLSLVMLGAIVLVIGSIVLWRRGAPKIRVVLALVLAAIAIANVLVMTIPYESGESPVEKAEQLD